ncbi:MAG: hypothetical protein JOZ10_18670 [Acidobacteria bacterium]|nr:hypothetical protein [Acidobacteriota bacterium]MBV9144822.1 hypothetical protein [Acidobacteriota bacterium]MBV9436034.1 hypothetical protein [Acidobacteriota bacterium]
MAASHSDSYVLSTDSTFRSRVQAALITAAISIWNEAGSTAFHVQRVRYAAEIMNSPGTCAPLFANAVATDATCLSDATQGGTVALTSGNVAAQAALVSDVHMDNAISAQFNSFLVPF